VLRAVSPTAGALHERMVRLQHVSQPAFLDAWCTVFKLPKPEVIGSTARLQYRVFQIRLLFFFFYFV
jgi:hypothetical protein